MRARAPGESALLLVDVADILQRRKIDYAVIGALAASIHGVIRASMDADVLLAAGQQQASDLQGDLREAGLRTDLVRGDADDPIPGMLKVSDEHENRVDLLLGLRGLDPQAFARGLDVPFQGSTLRFIGLEDFIAMKAFAGGPLDLLDAQRAIDGAGNSLDVDLLRRLTAGYGRDASRELEKMLRG